MPPRAKIETRTLAEQIADRLREDLLSGRLSAGERLSQEGLAERYAVSRIPVRDALRILHSEGLVSADPRFGTTVTPLSTADLEELYEMRLALEPVVSRLATPHLRPQDLAAMARHLRTMETSSRAGSRWFEAHARFHRALIVRSGRDRMWPLVDRLRAQTERYVRVYKLLAGAGDDLQVEHVRILEAARRGDPDEVAAVVREHLEIVRDRMLEHLQSEQAINGDLAEERS